MRQLRWPEGDPLWKQTIDAAYATLTPLTAAQGAGFGFNRPTTGNRWSVRGGVKPLKAMPIDYRAAVEIYGQAQRESIAILEGQGS